MAIISRIQARRLINANQAREESLLMADERGDVYVAISRFDVQRTDHYLATAADIARLSDAA